MGRRLNLGHLTEEECEQILKVIQKDFDLRQLEKDRLALIEAKVKDEDSRLSILSTREDFNDKYCMICFKRFLFFFIPKTRCSFCKHYYCKSCVSFDHRLKTDICFSCQKYHEFLLQSNSWFYKKLGDKFKRFGSAKVIRSLYKRKTESDAESDSGYHPSVRDNVCLSESNAKRSRPNLSKVFEMDETYASIQKNDEDEPSRTLSFYKQKLEAIKRHLRKAFVESKGGQESGQKSNYEDVLNKQTFNISLLLSSMANDLTSNLNESASKDQNASNETISKYVLEQCIDHIYESSSTEMDSYHPFGIDPDDLTLRGYIEKLSDSILSKMNADLKSSEDKIFQQEEEEVRKELLKLSNRARISQMGKEFSDSELEDLQVTTDSTSDIDAREWQTRHSADSMSASSLMKQEPPNPIDYDESEYDVDESSILAFASRKKDTLVLPVLDSRGSLKQRDVDLELTSQNETSSYEDPWTLSANGPATVMSNRIPIAPYDNYGKKKCGTTETEGDLKMFLPKRHSVDGPMIDNMNVYELSDLSDSSLGSPFEEVHRHEDSSLAEEVLERSNGCLVKNSPRGSITESSQSLVPWFDLAPQDVHVLCGEGFTCSCKLDEAKPIDVFWYRDENELIQLESDDRCTLLHQSGVHSLIVTNSQTSDGGIYHCVAINEHGTCQRTFTVTVFGRNEFHERSGETDWRKELAMNRLANAHQDKAELIAELTITKPVKVDTEDEKDIEVPALEVNTNTKQGSAEYQMQLWDHEQNNSPSIASGILAARTETQNVQNTLYMPENDYQKSNKGEDTLYKKQTNEKKMVTENTAENENSLSETSSEMVLDESALYNVPYSAEYLTRKLHYSSQKFENSEASETTRSSLTASTTGQHLRDLYSPYKTDKNTEKEITNELSLKGNVISDIAPLETGEQNLSTRFYTMAPQKGDVSSTRKNSPLHTASHSSDLKMTSAGLGCSEEVKSNDTFDTQYPKVIDVGPPKIEYKRYSRDYEVPNDDDSLAITDERSKTIGKRISSDMTSFTRRSNYFSSPSSSLSDVFEPDKGSYADGKEVHLNFITQNTPPTSSKNELDDIVLPSVKLLRMKFSAPRDTSAAENLLRKKNHPELKLYPDAEHKWKSAERVDPLFSSSLLPVSEVPLQPAPVNSRSTSRFSMSDGNLSLRSKPETTFQKEVIIRQQIVNKSQSDEFDEELDHSDSPQASSVTERVVIRPFSQRAGSTSSETRTSYETK